MALFGADPQSIAEFAADKDFDVLPENHAALRLFLAIETQWRCDNGIRTGLDYAAVCAVMHLRQEANPERLAEIQLIEQGVLQAQAERLKQRS